MLGLYLINVATHANTLLFALAKGGSPKFSPDGKKVIFTNASNHIAMINTDGTGLTTVIGWKGEQSMPDFSPDGTKIVFGSNSESKGKSLTGGVQLFVANADGTSPLQITRDTAGITRGTYGGAFSPSGTLVAFTGIKEGGEQHVYTVGTNGTGTAEVTAANGVAPSWSPDGSKLLFATSRNKGAFGYDLYTVDSTGGNEQALITGPDSEDLEGGWYRHPSTICQTFCALAHRFEPVLRFDTSERWRPLNIEQFFEEKRQYLCDTNTGCEKEPLANVAGLNKDRASTAYVAGEGDEEASYHSPYAECTSGGLLDCDSGPRSAIYYHLGRLNPSIRRVKSSRK